MKYLITLTLSFFTLALVAQKRDVYYYKNNNQRVDVLDSADFIRVVSEPDSGSTLYNVMELYKDNKKKRQGKSYLVDIFDPEGTVVSYYNNGKRHTVENYIKGKLSGEYYEYFPNGKLRTVRYYDPNRTERDEIKQGIDVYNYDIVTHNDSAGKALVVEKNGYYVGVDSILSTPVRHIDEEGPIKNGRRDGNWKGSEQFNKVTFTEVYENGTLISGTSTDSAGVTYQYKSRSMNPEFPGGINAFGKFLAHNVMYPAQSRERNIQGRVFLSYILKKDGSINNIKLIRTPPDGFLGAEAIRVIRLSPKWTPGKYFGIPVDVSYTVPIAFSLANH